MESRDPELSNDGRPTGIHRATAEQEPLEGGPQNPSPRSSIEAKNRRKKSSAKPAHAPKKKG